MQGSNLCGRIVVEGLVVKNYNKKSDVEKCLTLEIFYSLLLKDKIPNFTILISTIFCKNADK